MSTTYSLVLTLLCNLKMKCCVIFNLKILGKARFILDIEVEHEIGVKQLKIC